jgi:hypothetical protein
METPKSIRMGLRVSDNQRYLTYENGEPFFYLGDTAWELFHRLTREEADFYLETRAAQSFTVIQAVVLAEHEYARPNPYGDLPLQANDPTQPNEAYFQHMDYIVDRAAALGLTIGMLPTWGDKWNQKWGQGPEIFTPANAHAFGVYLGQRYREKPIIWILGGDRPVDGEEHAAIIRAMAAGLKEGDGGRHLRTFHPPGGQTSSQYFHAEDWLDFNMYQTGHARNRDCYHLIAAEYALAPVKPCMDAEPGYEDHPNGFKVENGYLDAYDVRKAAYWDLFAGAHGHTYGCHDIWQFLDTDRFPPVTFARTPWREAIHLPGAAQMQWVRKLIQSRPFLSRIPDQSLILSEVGMDGDHVQATRSEDGEYAFVYFPSGKPVTVDLRLLSGSTIAASWSDPRTGEATAIGEFPQGQTEEFTPPVSGEDWVLTLDDIAQEFGPPGH